MKNKFLTIVLTLIILLSCAKQNIPAKISTLESFKRPIGDKVVLVDGCFDLIHKNNIDFLQKSRAMGGYLIVALESDDAIKLKKSRNSINTQTDRAKILSHIINVDEIVLLPKLTGYNDYLEMVKKIHPNIIAITEPDPQIQNKKKMADIINSKLVTAMILHNDTSTSKIIDAIKSSTQAFPKERE